MQIDRKQLMQEAWATARRRAEFFGTAVRAEFASALKTAWVDARKAVAAAATVAAPVAPTFAEITWAPILATVAEREAAGTADALDASFKLMAETSIAEFAAHAAHMARCEALAARWA